MKITKEWVRDEEACFTGKRNFLQYFPEGEADMESAIRLMLEKHNDEHLHWLDEKTAGLGMDAGKAFAEAFILAMGSLQTPSDLGEPAPCDKGRAACTGPKSYIYVDSPNSRVASLGDSSYTECKWGKSKTCSIGDDDQTFCYNHLYGHTALLGNNAKAFCEGYRMNISSMGDDLKLAAVGEHTSVNSQGANALIFTKGGGTAITSTGTAPRIGCIGDYTYIYVLHSQGVVSVDGKYAELVIGAGAKFRVGESSTVSFSYFEGNGKPACTHVRTGEEIQADVWYTVTPDGKVKELGKETE